MENLKREYREIYKAYMRFAESQGLSIHSKAHVESFNAFVERGIQEIISDYGPITINRKVKGRQISLKIDFGDVFFISPSSVSPLNSQTRTPIFPAEVLARGGSYTMSVYANYTMQLHTQESGGFFKLKNDVKGSFKFGEIPVMVRSKYCSLFGLSPQKLELIREDPYNIGGYFIINGKEYTIIMNENKAENFLFKNKIPAKSEAEVWIQSKKSNKYEYPYYTKLTLSKSALSSDQRRKKSGKRTHKMYVMISISKDVGVHLPLSVVFRALGVVTDKEIYDYICYDNNPHIAALLRETLLFKDGIYEERDAMIYIAKKYRKNNKYAGQLRTKEITDDKMISYITSTVLDQQLFPHIGGIGEKSKKIAFLARMARSCFSLHIGLESPVDRDNYGNKRILTSGRLYGRLFLHHANIAMQHFNTQLTTTIESYNPQRDYTNLVEQMWPHGKMSKMASNISTGEWPAGSNSKAGKKSGVSQHMERKGALDQMMYETRIMTPTTPSGGRTIGLRELHATTWGLCSPNNTPDGGNVGVNKHKTIFSEISPYVDPKYIVNFLEKSRLTISVDSLNPRHLAGLCAIFINGSLLFYCRKGGETTQIADKLRELRRIGANRFMTVEVDYTLWEIKVYTDSERILSPYYIVDSGKLRMNMEIMKKLKSGLYKWSDLMIGVKESANRPIIEYLHVHELQANCLVAPDFPALIAADPRLIKYTHCELDMTTILDSAELVYPAAHMSPSPRVTFGSSMVKQALKASIMADAGFGKSSTKLRFAQRPIVDTLGRMVTGLDKTPAGVNVLLAIATWTGYNQEDAIIFNKASVDNGLFSAYVFKTFMSKRKTANERFHRPNRAITKNYKVYKDYSLIGENGLPKVGAVIYPGSVIIGKVKALRKSDAEFKGKKYQYIDISEVYKGTQPAIIDYADFPKMASGTTAVVRIRMYRNVNIGDKFASTAAQKGTASLIIPKENMPYLESGKVPDIIFNPHGIITRMTMSQILDLIASRIATHTGTVFDATPFHCPSVTDILGKLRELGIKDNGESFMYNGETGERMKVKIYSGYIYYQRLKHMVNDKISIRGRGPYSNKTRQATQGKKQDGGPRKGYMEKDSDISHGTAAILKSFMYDKSDKFEFKYSENTGIHCVGNDYRSLYIDKAAGGNRIVRAKIPWMTNMALDMARTAGINPRLKF